MIYMVSVVSLTFDICSATIIAVLWGKSSLHVGKSVIDGFWALGCWHLLKLLTNFVIFLGCKSLETYQIWLWMTKSCYKISIMKFKIFTSDGGGGSSISNFKDYQHWLFPEHKGNRFVSLNMLILNNHGWEKSSYTNHLKVGCILQHI